MGRQIAIAMELEDEQEFLSFVRTIAEVDIYRSWSPKPEAIGEFVEDWTASPFFLHNRSISWTPQFELVHYRDLQTGQSGQYYRLQNHHGPVIEYSRHPLDATSPQVAGRLYWSKFFVSNPQEVGYDVGAFDTWFGTIARWVRKHGCKVRHGSTEPWCLPKARSRLQNEL